MARISPTGLLRSFRTGNIVVTASSGDISGTLEVNIVPRASRPVLATIVINPSSANVAIGQTQQFTAQGFDQFGNPMELRGLAWRTNNIRSGAINSRTGLFTARASGTSNITASLGRVLATATVTVP